MKQVYILLSRTNTLPSRFIHHWTKGSFTHASISLTPGTDRFFSYARRKLNNPLKAGLITENIHTFIFALYPESPCVLYSVDVSDEAYERMEKRIQYYFSHYKKAKYNFLGAIPLRFGVRIPRRFRLVCSQFVALMLYESGEITLPKDPYMTLPNDFPKIDGLNMIYSGTLKDCHPFSSARV